MKKYIAVLLTLTLMLGLGAVNCSGCWQLSQYGR